MGNKKTIFKIVISVALFFVVSGVYASDKSRAPAVFDRIEYYDTHRDELDEDNFEHLCLLAQLFANDAAANEQNNKPYIDDYFAAADYYLKAIDLEPKYPMPYRGLAIIYYYGIVDDEEALYYAQEAIDRKWEHFDMYLIAGILLKNQARFDEARAILKKAKMKMDKQARTNPSIRNIPEYKVMEEFLK